MDKSKANKLMEKKLLTLYSTHYFRARKIFQFYMVFKFLEALVFEKTKCKLKYTVYDFGIRKYFFFKAKCLLKYTIRRIWEIKV